MEDPVNQLANYRLQLGQVEAALTGDPENEELLNLKKDLDEIIGITQELVGETKKTVTWKIGMTVMAPYTRDNKMYEAIIISIDESAGTAKVKFANYTTHETILISQLSDFTGKRTERGSRWQSEPKSARAPLPSTVMDNDVGINTKAAREKARIEIEKRRKKAAKKKERLAAMDAAGERQKKSWQSFNNKVVKKKKAGVVRYLTL